jgi:Mrp family chromosome partitioning ATPase
VVAQAADGVLVVLGPNSADRSSVISVRQQLEKVGARVLGGVLNGPDPELIRSDYYYY